RGLWVIVDEAYYPFGAATALGMLPGCERLIITRTLSKSGALAGLRLGYAIAAPAVIARLDALRMPYNVNALATAAALALLEEPAWLTERVAEISAERERVAGRLAELDGVRVWLAVANFLLVELPVPDAAAIGVAMAERGVLVRHYPHPRLRRCLRITIGRAAENDRMRATLVAALAGARTEVRG
nr:aminotransferase class I/II-fold pyridoxal phosphate-dependent enzyme [Ktedonobacterales bacterium]